VIRAALGPGITLIDSATETAREVSSVLAKLQWLGSNPQAVRKYFVTDSPARFEKIGKRFLGDDSLHAEQVNVSAS
jgi:glutamate racemase